MMQFEWPWMAVLLPLPWLMARILPHAPQNKDSALHVPFMDLINFHAGQSHASEQLKSTFKHMNWILWIFCVLALMRPLWLDEPVPLQLSGRDIILAVDLSGSMGETDFELEGKQVNRLEVVKRAARKFISQRSGDRIGLILFGEQPYLQTPLTHDHTTLNQMLDDAIIGLAGDGTAIGDAIGLGIKRLQDRPENQRILILLTDGRNTAGHLQPRRAAELAQQRALKIYTIGLGSEARVEQNWFIRRLVNPSRELDETGLIEVAKITGGAYFRATDLESLEKIYDTLNELEPVETDQRQYIPRKELYPWPLGGALVLSLALCAMYLWSPRALALSNILSRKLSPP